MKLEKKVNVDDKVCNTPLKTNLFYGLVFVCGILDYLAHAHVSASLNN
jgi:hypothetical protein